MTFKGFNRSAPLIAAAAAEAGSRHGSTTSEPQWIAVAAKAGAA